MGPVFVRRVLQRDSTEGKSEQRFGVYYPRLFAYALSAVGNPARARDLVTDILHDILISGEPLPEEQFRLALFAEAQAVCGRQARAVYLDFGLTTAERRVLSLVVDGGLSLEEAAMVSGQRDAGVVLYSAVHKLRLTHDLGEVPHFFRRS
jgi:DNA-directed RNA polymerase specialized sigma24 family protein